MGLDHSFERDPRHHGSHLSQEHITLGALLLGRIVERRKTQLVHPSTPRINDPSVSRSSVGSVLCSRDIHVKMAGHRFDMAELAFIGVSTFGRIADA